MTAADTWMAIVMLGLSMLAGIEVRAYEERWLQRRAIGTELMRLQEEQDGLS